MNREQMTAPFAEEELRTFEGRGGKTMTYIEDETVMDRLDAGYGYGNWQLHVETTVDPGVVKVRLSVREYNEWISFEDYGYPNREGGETLKEAVSDGIRRCGRFVGIARDLYRKSTYEPGGALGRPAKPRSDVAKANDANVERMKERRPPPEHFPAGQWQAHGIASAGKAPFDGELRQTPEGGTFGFRLVTPEKTGYSVAVEGDLALPVSLVWESLSGTTVRVSGQGELVPWEKEVNGQNRPMPPYRLIRATVVETDEIRLPASPETLAPDAALEAEMDAVVDALP